MWCIWITQDDTGMKIWCSVCSLSYSSLPNISRWHAGQLGEYMSPRTPAEIASQYEWVCCGDIFRVPVWFLSLDCGNLQPSPATWMRVVSSGLRRMIQEGASDARSVAFHTVVYQVYPMPALTHPWTWWWCWLFLPYLKPGGATSMWLHLDLYTRQNIWSGRRMLQWLPDSRSCCTCTNNECCTLSRNDSFGMSFHGT